MIPISTKMPRLTALETAAAKFNPSCWKAFA
jgi:hypothetical protein